MTGVDLDGDGEQGELDIDLGDLVGGDGSEDGAGGEEATAETTEESTAEEASDDATEGDEATDADASEETAEEQSPEGEP